MTGTDLWYFAYGSNLDPETFSGWRGMRPSDARPARLRGYELVFDLAVGDGERAVANLDARTSAFVHGVAYRITEDEGGRLDRTEGVPAAYRRVEVELETDAGGLCAFTYVSSWRRPGRKPSERYMNLILRGARHHALPASWVGYLRRIDLAVDERQSQLELFVGAPHRPATPSSGRGRPA